MSRPVKVLITGIAGYVGSHLADKVLDKIPDAELNGLDKLNSINPAIPNLQHLQNCSNLKLFSVDLAIAPDVYSFLNELMPDYIFHMAARSHVAPSFDNPSETLTNNLVCTFNLFEAAKLASEANKGYKPVILNPGSGDQYGFIQPDELPVREEQPFRPGNPYAVSKITQEMLGYQYFKSYNLQIINTRAFNSIGPRQSPELATSAFARQIALNENRIGKGLTPEPIMVGSLEASRDYTDVRDVAEAYWIAVTSGKCEAGLPYNICSGKNWKMSDVLDLLLKKARYPLETKFDPRRARPSDVPAVRGDNTRFFEATGWTPGITLEKSMEDLLDYWRSEIENQANA